MQNTRSKILIIIQLLQTERKRVRSPPVTHQLEANAHKDVVEGLSKGFLLGEVLIPARLDVTTAN